VTSGRKLEKCSVGLKVDSTAAMMVDMKVQQLVDWKE
jgi:hypothetical protein